MQINISHLQPPVGGAGGQEDEVQPIHTLIIQVPRGAGEVRLGSSFCILPLNYALPG